MLDIDIQYLVFFVVKIMMVEDNPICTVHYVVFFSHDCCILTRLCTRRSWEANILPLPQCSSLNPKRVYLQLAYCKPHHQISHLYARTILHIPAPLFPMRLLTDEFSIVQPSPIVTPAPGNCSIVQVNVHRSAETLLFPKYLRTLQVAHRNRRRARSCLPRLQYSHYSQVSLVLINLE
jgi:hypothetical protein